MEFIEVVAIVIGAIALAAATYVLMKKVGDSISGIPVNISAADFSFGNDGSGLPSVYLPANFEGALRQMKRIAKRLKRFLNDDNGMEFIQVAAIVVGAIALAAAVYVLMNNVGNTVIDVGKELDIP